MFGWRLFSFMNVGVVLSSFVLICAMLIGLMMPSNVKAKSTWDFSEQELTWLSKKRILRVVVLENNYPYMFKNRKGEADGIVPDFIQELADLGRLRVEYQFVNNWKSAHELLDKGNADIFPISFHKPANEDNYRYTNRYLPYQKQLITRTSASEIRSSNQLKGKVLAVVEGYDIANQLQRTFSDITLNIYSTREEAVRAVHQGEAFGIVSELVSTMALAQQLGLSNLKPNGMKPRWSESFAQITLPKNSNTLEGILNKSLKKMGFTIQNYILNKWLKSSPYRMKVNGGFDFGNPPYMYTDSPTVGLEYAYLQAVFNNMGLQIGESHRASFSTRKELIKVDPDIDFNSGIMEKQSGVHYYSDPLLKIEYVAISLKARELSLSFASVEGKSNVGSVLQEGDSPSRKAFNLFTQQYQPKSTTDLSSLKEGFKGLNDQSLDFIIVEKRVLDWHLAHESKLNSKTIEIHDTYLASFPIYVEFRNEDLRDRFNASLKSLSENKPAVRTLTKSHIDTDFRPQLQRADIIAEVMGMYLYNDDIEGLEAVAKVFDLSQDIAAMEIFANKTEQILFSVVSGDNGLETQYNFDASQYVSVTKDSIYSSDSGELKVGSVTFYFDLSKMDNSYAYLPSLEFFNHLSEKEQGYISRVYEENDLIGQILNLTPSELNWIKSNPVQRLAVDPSALPYDEINSDRQYVGIVSDFVKIIESKTGLSIHAADVSSWREAETLIAANEVTLISAAVENVNFLPSFKSSLALLSSPIAIASKSDASGMLLGDLTGWRVGVIRGASNTLKLVEHYPYIKWEMIESTEEGLQKVADNSLDATLDTVHVLNYLMSTHGYHDMKIIGRSNYIVSPTLHVSAEEPILQSIIDKAIRSIDQKERNEIVSKWSAPKYIDKTNYELIYLISGFSVLFILVSLAWNRRLKIQIQHTQKAQADAVHLQKQLFDVLNASPIAAAIVQNDKVVYTNERALEMFQIETDDVGEIDVESIYPDVDIRVQVYEELIENQTIIDKEIVLKNTRDEQFTALTSYYLIKNEGEAATLFWAYDITELKDLNVQLSQAMLEADSANQAKSDFLANMSHEIRTPMNAIIGMSYLALQEQQSTTAKHYVQKVHRSAEFLLSIINDILDFSKIEAGKLDIESAPFKLDAVVEGLNDITSVSAKDKPIKILLSVASETPNDLVGDAVRLFQILLNLMGNAIKFTPSGEVALNIALISRNGNKARLKFEVQDSGIGIDEKKQSELFSAFSQADASITRKYGGTGLGLNISQKLVNAMGGEISVVSELGKGSCFDFELDFLLNDTVAESENSDWKLVDGQKNLEVLLVEDNETNQDLALAFLSKLKVTAEIANNGLEAVNKAKQKRFDAILMDIQMPVMDGFSATTEIRHFDKETPIIAMSANLAEEVREKAKICGMTDFVDKPIALTDLAAKLGVLLNEGLLRVEGPPLAVISDTEVFNRSAGLRHCNEDLGLFNKLTTRFYDQISEIIPAFNTLIESKDNEGLIRYAHTLKSTSAAIGAIQVSQRFSSLENTQGNEIEDREHLLSALAPELNALTIQINHYLENEIQQAHEGARAKEPSELDSYRDENETFDKERVEQLIALIEAYDVEAKGLVSELLEHSSPNNQTLHTLAKQLEEYDFELALETAKQLPVS
ncbi:transporter substrate-binding domain-containing protein [Vibrio sp. ZSDE26]|uniref:histidine kinase n=1 Tax=Vibrio amylolyticus TaxID=2847292 RepID=A0A9X1XJF0_9VIBR|nr:transporter substrate-binding domain-containing protein [Vibrio amylolyticus]MCK6263531.1 transporter substrate-binding domain-containing protein [Vibrio amylolyticus]